MDKSLRATKLKRGASMQNKEDYNNNANDCFNKKLLEPGWAGELSGYELVFIKSQLRSLSPLRQKWGFRPSAKRFPSAYIRHVAMYGLNGFTNEVLTSAKIKKRIKTIHKTSVQKALF